MKLAEIFFSLQGEGKNQGKPCLFIRLAGCNLHCRWCDTGYALGEGRDIAPDVILEEVWRRNPKLICITGGEPLLQEGELEPLLASLSRKGIPVDIETNGTLDFRRLQPYASICMDVKCPSSGEMSDLLLLGALRPEDSVKFVVSDKADLLYATEVIGSYRIAGEIFMTPVYGTDPRVIAEYLLATCLPVRFQLQLQKIIGVK
ncbi:MAG: radical SAM protein [Methanoregula sp.]|nr:radical SAM protein [Methanoregula sp.]WML67260.1 MAG: 7-carboxy-7-deazaguanine synthase [Methanoregula sp. SKADARSKE-2]